MGDQRILSEMAVAYGQAEKTGLYAVMASVNAVTARGAGSVTVQLRIEYPFDMEKARIYRMLKQIRAFCRDQKIGLEEKGVCQSPAVSRAQVIAVAAGRRERSGGAKAGSDKRRQDILITNWIGLGGTLRACWEKRQQLKERFHEGFLRQIDQMEPYLFTGEDARFALRENAAQIHALSEGGILTALWKLAKETGQGLRVDMKALPIRQETVEVCEYLGVNPYQLTSVGSLMILAENGEIMAEKLREKQIPAAVVGRVTADHDKILYHGEEIRYLDRPAPDEILKVI